MKMEFDLNIWTDFYEKALLASKKLKDIVKESTACDYRNRADYLSVIDELSDITKNTSAYLDKCGMK